MKFLIELETTGGNDPSREQVAEVVAAVLEGSTAREALGDGMFGALPDAALEVSSLQLLDPSPRVGVEHLTVYVDPARGEQRFCVDEDHADDEHGRHVPGEGSTRFTSPVDAAACVAEHLGLLNGGDPESQDSPGIASLRLVSTPPDRDSSEIEGHNYGLSIDGPSFREQRELLLQLFESAQQQTSLAISPEQGELLEGLVNLTDAIADQAADQYGIDCLL